MQSWRDFKVTWVTDVQGRRFKLLLQLTVEKTEHTEDNLSEIPSRAEVHLLPHSSEPCTFSGILCVLSIFKKKREWERDSMTDI